MPTSYSPPSTKRQSAVGKEGVAAVKGRLDVVAIDAAVTWFSCNTLVAAMDSAAATVSLVSPLRVTAQSVPS